MKKFHIIKRSYIWIVCAAALICASILIFILNAKFSEEFTGGVNISILSDANPDLIQERLSSYLASQGYANANVYTNQTSEDLQIRINAPLENDEKVAELSADVKNFLVSQQLIFSDDDITGQAVIGPSVGSYMKKSAVQALVAGMLLMVVYILFAFAKIRKEIPAQILGISVLCVLVFNVCITLGVYGLRMMFNSTIQVDTVFIVAMLTVVAYGINDVIVIFDRVRENILKFAKDKNVVIGKIIEDSLRQTMRRSIGTSLSTLLVLLAMFIFGTGILQQFAFTVAVGVVVATFGSIFVGAPLAYLLMGKFKPELKSL
jgi:preprotein translocase SecF subunit